jgi:hypothetical protein
MWDQSWFMTMLQSLWHHKIGLERGMLVYSTNRYDESFFTKFDRK